MATTVPVGRWVTRTAGTGRAVNVDLQVLVLDVDVDLFGFGQHRHGGGRGVDAALRLGHRHPLHPVRAALVLEPAPGRVALDQERDLVEAAHVGGVGAEHLDLQPVALGVADVHLEQVLGEQVGLLSPLRPPDLDDDVLAVVGVFGQQQDLELVADPGDLDLGLLDLRPQHVAVLALGVGQHLLGRGQVVERPPVGVVGLDHRGQRLVPTGGVAHRLGIGQDGRVRELALDRLIFIFQTLQAIEHDEVEGTGG